MRRNFFSSFFKEDRLSLSVSGGVHEMVAMAKSILILRACSVEEKEGEKKGKPAEIVAYSFLSVASG